MTTFNIPTMGPTPVTLREIRDELHDLLRYSSSEKEWPHHRQQARDRSAKIRQEAEQAGAFDGEASAENTGEAAK